MRKVIAGWMLALSVAVGVYLTLEILDVEPDRPGRVPGTRTEALR